MLCYRCSFCCCHCGRLFVFVLLCMKAKLVQDTYVGSVIRSLPQLNGVIDVSVVFVHIGIIIALSVVLCMY